ncbi:type 1 fimbrial protein [Obesumbacterium proteus]|nr:type 1 fimbrial protein [Obesumbacterium proteus]
MSLLRLSVIGVSGIFAVWNLCTVFLVSVFHKLNITLGLKMKLNKLVTVVSLVMMAGAANAAITGTPGGQGKVNFRGQIVDAPCTIKNDSTNQIVEMGAITMSTLEAGRSALIPFELHLESCELKTDGSAYKASIIFDGVRAVSGQDDLLLLNGSAKGAGLGIIDKNGDDLKLGQEADLGDMLKGDNTLNFTAYLQKTGGSAATITPGSYTSVANFTMTYN